jgi:hypothetical protein
VDLDRQTFLAAWQAATPLLEQDALMQYLTNEWEMTLPGILATLETALASAPTVEALFEYLNHQPAVALMPYAALLVLRTLVDPTTQPATALAVDTTIASTTAQVIFGNATISGTVHNSGALIVLGDLTIEDIYSDAAWSYSLLAVGGSVRARGVLSFGDLLIRGDLLVSDVVHGWYNDYSLLVGGVLRARAMLKEYHHTHYAALAAQETLDLYGDIPRLREVFIDELFNETERNGAIEVEFDAGLLFERLEAGQPAYRS